MGWWDLHWVFTGLLLRSIFRIGNVPTWWEGRSQLDLDSNRSFATRQTVSYLSAMTNCVGGIAAELLFESLSNCTGPPVRQIKKTFATKTFPKQARDILWECSATGATATPLKICRWQFPRWQLLTGNFVAAKILLVAKIDFWCVAVNDCG